MKNYLYVINKVSNNNLEVKNVINNIKGCIHKFISYSQNNIECYLYTNENINDELLNIQTEEYFFGFSGQLANTFDEVQQGIIKSENGQENKYISKLAGANSISFFHSPTETVQAFNSFSGVNPVFYCETEERIVIGIDPLVVNCVAYDSNKPKFDLSNISSFLMMGYFFSHDTLFKNVKSIPHNTYITVKGNSIQIKDIDNAVNDMFSIEPSKQLYEDITDSYLKSFDVIPNTSRSLNVGLTGGKDSRLIALGLKGKGIDFKAVTRGNEDHPDVQVAKLLAKKMNLNHTVNHSVNKQVNEVKIDLVDKILKTMIGTNGLLYGYENIKYSTEYIGNIGITGVGAEAIRGGFGITREKETDNIPEFLLKTYFPYQDLILPKYRDGYRDELIDRGSNSNSLRETGNKLYMEFYNGKRTGGARLALSYYNNSLSPFFDSNFLKHATKININEIATEKLHYNIMKLLDQDIAMLPFANDRWHFEKRGPLNPNDFKGWLERSPVMPKTKRGGYNWRLFRNQDETFIKAFKALLLDDKNSEVYEVVDYEKIKNIFDGKVSGNYNRVLWALLSIKLYIEYFDEKEQAVNEIKLELPPTTEKNVQENNIYDLKNEITSLNDKLLLENKNDFLVRVNQESEKFGYLIVGTGNLTTPATGEINKKFLIDNTKKTLSVRFCLNILNESSEISLYIMFFDKQKKRIFSKEYDSKVKNGISYLSRTIKIKEEYHSVKFAIKLKSKSTEPILNIKYGYLKYN